MIFRSITPQKFAALKAKLLDTHQAQVTGETSGQIIDSGVIANYRFDPTARTLAVTVIHHPFYISEGHIITGISNAIANV